MTRPAAPRRRSSSSTPLHRLAAPSDTAGTRRRPGAAGAAAGDCSPADRDNGRHDRQPHAGPRVEAVPQLVRHDGWDYHLHAVDPATPLAERIAVETAMAMVGRHPRRRAEPPTRCARDDHLPRHRGRSLAQPLPPLLQHRVRQPGSGGGLPRAEGVIGGTVTQRPHSEPLASSSCTPEAIRSSHRDDPIRDRLTFADRLELVAAVVAIAWLVLAVATVAARRLPVPRRLVRDRCARGGRGHGPAVRRRGGAGRPRRRHRAGRHRRTTPPCGPSPSSTAAP